MSPDKAFEIVEDVQQYACYAFAGTALLIGVCWTAGWVVLDKSISIIRRKKN